MDQDASHRTTVFDISDGSAATPLIPLDLHTELNLIAHARLERVTIAEARAAGGSAAVARVPQPALDALIWQYIPWPRSAASKAAKRGAHDDGESRANALIPLVEAVDAVSDRRSLAVQFGCSAGRVDDTYTLGGVAHVPAVTRKNFLAILRSADGYTRAGLNICEQRGMSTAADRGVTRALIETQSTDLLDNEDQPLAADSIRSIEDRAEVTVALRLLDGLRPVTNRIVRRYCGVDDYDQQSDVEIARPTDARRTTPSRPATATPRTARHRRARPSPARASVRSRRST